MGELFIIYSSSNVEKMSFQGLLENPISKNFYDNNEASRESIKRLQIFQKRNS